MVLKIKQSGKFSVLIFCLMAFGSSVWSQTLSYSPKLIPFPNQGINSTSAASYVTVSNPQSVPLSITGIQATAPFAQTNNCGRSVAAGGSCTIGITFAPTAVKYYSSTVTVTSNATNSPLSIAVNGNGIVPVSYTPAVGGFYFNNQIATTPSTPQTVTLTNKQTTPLTLTSIKSSSPAYTYTTNCGNGLGGGTLSSGSSCTILVTFDPPSTISYPATLTIVENAYGSPISIPLQGTGIAGTEGPTITVKPSAPCILPSETMQFSADITGTPNTAVTWYVDGIKGGNTGSGTVTSTGFYSAPSTAASHTIKAVSQTSSSVSGAAVVSLTNSPSYTIYPYVTSIPVGAQQTFQAQMCGVPDLDNVSFTVDNIAGGNTTVGTVTPAGVYTAPAVAGKHTIRVTDAALNKTSGGVATVFSNITADFGSRANTTAAIPANMFGYGRGESLPKLSDRETLSQAGMTEVRMSAQIATVYATQTPNWTSIDALISTAQAAGQHVLLQLNQSPAWLQPTTGGCAGTFYAAPTNITQWAQITQAYVAHMDSVWPGVVPDYEIWNEPNATGMCSASDHMTVYMSIYAAAAPLMKAQAAQDEQTIRVGGPVLSGYSQTWLSTLLTSSSTAPYVDFVSYHQYFFGSTQLQAQWGTFTGDDSLYEVTQDTSVGAFATYNKVLAQVALGKQPLGAKTPVYVTEFNTNWAFFQDCCRNDPTYAPLFNALYVTDMLDSVYNGSAQMPAKLFYFAGSAYPYFCMLGVEDANSDCLYSVGATPVPYPQYYAFDLLASPSYLGLSGGGYMAKSLSTPTGGGGLATAAFYTTSQDAIVITNPTATAYPSITVILANPGLTATHGTLYEISNGTQINATSIPLTTQGTTLSTTIPVPAYSVQAIAVQ